MYSILYSSMDWIAGYIRTAQNILHLRPAELKEIGLLNHQLVSYLPYSLSKFDYSSASYISVKEAITTKCWQSKSFKSQLSF